MGEDGRVTLITAVVLAAGRGSRMGAPKALLTHPVTGRSLVEEAVCRLTTAGLSTVVVVTGAAGDEVEATMLSGAWARECAPRQPCTVHLAPSPDWADGMGASLRAGLAAAESAAPESVAAVVALVDLPDVTSAVIERVCREAGSQPTGAITESLARAAYGGIPGHPVLLGRAHWTGVQRAAVGDQGARGYLQGRDVRLIECGDLATGADVDTQAEWTRMMDP